MCAEWLKVVATLKVNTMRVEGGEEEQQEQERRTRTRKERRKTRSRRRQMVKESVSHMRDFHQFWKIPLTVIIQTARGRSNMGERVQWTEREIDRELERERERERERKRARERKGEGKRGRG